VFENAAEAILITDKDNNIIRVNRAFSEITGYSREEVIGKNPNIQKSGIHDAAFYKKMWDDINNKNFWQGEIVNKKRNGDLWPCWMTISRIEHENSHYYIAVASDISIIKKSRKEIEFLAYHDTLTSLPNRLLFKDRIEHAIAKAKRNKKQLCRLFCGS
jgi:PAS domain S-box-containing protein